MIMVRQNDLGTFLPERLDDSVELACRELQVHVLEPSLYRFHQDLQPLSFRSIERSFFRQGSVGSDDWSFDCPCYRCESVVAPQPVQANFYEVRGESLGSLRSTQ